MLDTLDVAAVRSWSRTAVELLDANRDEIDALNVFPVPDGDTGTNMLATLRAADQALRTALEQAGEQDDPVAALTAMADGAARGAVGNSGFILSQVLRGLADAVTAAGRWDAAALTAGLGTGARLGRLAVVTPVEGTILSVMAAAADSAHGATLAEVLAAAVLAADGALQRTPTQLAELAEAGVVDAGGQGLLVLLDALTRIVTGAPAVLTDLAPPRPPVAVPPVAVPPVAVPPVAVPPVAVPPVAVPPVAVPPAAVPCSGDLAGHQFEVQYELDATVEAVTRLRTALAAAGDSVVVVPIGDGSWKVHVHVDDVGAAIEAGVEAGRPHRIEVVRFADQIAAHGGPARPVERPAGAVVAVAPGAGLAHLFEAEGVHVVDGGPGTVPSTDDVVAAIAATGARELVLLPNASRVTGVAEAAAVRARAGGVHVAVVPTRSPVQGLAAIAVHDAARRFDDDVVAMAEAAAATRFAQLAVARDQALTAVGICEPGDVLGMIDGEVVEIGRGLLAVAFGLVDRLLGVGAELMTILVGQDAPTRVGELIEAHVRGRAPLTDVVVYQGGQPDFPVIIGVE